MIDDKFTYPKSMFSSRRQSLHDIEVHATLMTDTKHTPESCFLEKVQSLETWADMRSKKEFAHKSHLAKSPLTMSSFDSEMFDAQMRRETVRVFQYCPDVPQHECHRSTVYLQTRLILDWFIE